MGLVEDERHDSEPLKERDKGSGFRDEKPRSSAATSFSLAVTERTETRAAIFIVRQGQKRGQNKGEKKLSSGGKKLLGQERRDGAPPNREESLREPRKKSVLSKEGAYRAVGGPHALSEKEKTVAKGV